ncbi:MAG: hypothetical protein LH649_08815 [Pseudanabaena sp. CAN_BIN31]|nr:hypothetical protein [Pseudanabaena sp. CAN_BIN31]
MSKLLRDKNIAMFHMGRCGSTVVGDMLNAHPDCTWASELFEGKKNLALSSTEKLEFVKSTIQTSCYSQITKFYGFETKYMPSTHLSEDCIGISLEEYVSLLRNLGFSKFIVLHRKNYLRRIISGEVGRQKGQWHSTQEVKNPTPVKLDINAIRYGNTSHNLLDLFHSFDENYHFLQNLISKDNNLFIIYEDDIFENPIKAYNKVCSFLEIEPIPSEINLKRTNPFSYQQMVHNFGEVQSLLENTSYGWMLNSD